MIAALLTTALVGQGHAQQQGATGTGSSGAGSSAKGAPPAPPASAVEVPQAFPDSAVGDEITARGANLADKKIAVALRAMDSKRVEATVVRIAAGEFVFRVPDTATGRYHVLTKIAEGDEQYSGDLRIVAAEPLIRRIVAISPWSKLLGGRFDVEIIGERLPPPAECRGELASRCMTLLLDNEPLELRQCTVRAPARATAPVGSPTVAPADGTVPSRQLSGSTTLVPEAPTPSCASLAESELPDRNKDGVEDACFWPSRPAQRVCVHGLTIREYGSARLLQVSATGRMSQPINIHVSRLTPRSIKWVSFAFFVALLGALVSVGHHVREAAAGNTTRISVLSWMLLDEQTNTYSLSKTQLLLWAAVIIYCYVYFFLASVYVQGSFEFPALPRNFGWLLGVTGGTTVFTTMLTRARGSKGAGGPRPALSDLVSTGGVLAPDRAQFLAWTIIGCIGYVVLVLKQQPEMLTVLPELREELVSVMGLSALVYVGGKAVRLPGPVINEVKPSLNDKKDELTLTAKGQNLDEKAIISIDGVPVVEKDRKTPSTGSTVDTSLKSEMTLVMTGEAWNTGDHRLRITNRDGQYAELWFAVDAPELTNIADEAMADQVKAASTAVDVKVAGKNLRVGSSAEWLAPGQTVEIELTAEQVQVKADGTGATVKLVPGAAKGSGKLTLVSPRGIRATRQVTVA
jgi:hypothetical protein